MNRQSINNDYFSIVGLKGDSPLNLQSSATNPEFIIDLRKKDYFPGLHGHYVADPYIYIYRGSQFLFCELLLTSGKGVIARLERENEGDEWRSPLIVLEENFHISYPTIHHEGGNIYMLVESADNTDVRLYRAENSNLSEWSICKKLLDGEYYDPTIFRRGGNWYMFASTCKDFSQLCLFYSEDGLNGPWNLHPQSPLKGDSSSSRPAGPVLEWKSKQYRLSQDCSQRYGQSVRAFEIVNLTRDCYQEKEYGVILKDSGVGWNSKGMHHLRVYKSDRDFVYAVSDGYTRS